MMWISCIFPFAISFWHEGGVLGSAHESSFDSLMKHPKLSNNLLPMKPPWGLRIFRILGIHTRIGWLEGFTMVVRVHINKPAFVLDCVSIFHCWKNLFEDCVVLCAAFAMWMWWGGRFKTLKLMKTNCSIKLDTSFDTGTWTTGTFKPWEHMGHSN